MARSCLAWACRLVQASALVRVFDRTRTTLLEVMSDSALRDPDDVVTPHDFEQAGMVGNADGLSRLRDVPVMLLESREDDLPFGLSLQRLERSGFSRRIGRLVSVV